MIDNTKPPCNKSVAAMNFNVKISIKKLTDKTLFQRACEMTTHGKKVRMPLSKIYQSEHSPCRTQEFWIEMSDIPTFVSVHLVRHKIGVEHFVTSNRSERGGSAVGVGRLTPVNHAMKINAQALINICRRRLCYKAAITTVAVMMRIKREMEKIDPELAPFLVPECVYRNGLCPEMSECKPGLVRVMRSYSDYRKMFKNGIKGN